MSVGSLLFTIDQMKVKHRKEMEKMKRELLREQRKVKGLEDKFGVTQKRRWETRKRIWLMKWLYDNDIDAYEYLLRVIHKTLMDPYKRPSWRLRKRLLSGRRNLNHIRDKDKYYHDETINIYGINFRSHPIWWSKDKPMALVLSNNEQRQTKKHFINCCEQNNINYKKSWNKNKLMCLVLRYK